MKLLKDLYVVVELLFTKKRVCEDHSYDQDRVTLGVFLKSFVFVLLTPSRGRWVSICPEGSILLEYESLRVALLFEVRSWSYYLLCVDFEKRKPLESLLWPKGYKNFADFIHTCNEKYDLYMKNTYQGGFLE